MPKLSELMAVENKLVLIESHLSSSRFDDDIRKLIDVVRAAYGCLDNGRLHGEVCPADDYDFNEGKQPGECECGITAWRKALAALEQAK